MDKIQLAWISFTRCARNAGVGKLLESALEAAEREIKERDPVLRHRPRQRRDKAIESVIHAAQNVPDIPHTWHEIADLRESAIMAYAVSKAVDIYHRDNPDAGCGL